MTDEQFKDFLLSLPFWISLFTTFLIPKYIIEKINNNIRMLPSRLTFEDNFWIRFITFFMLTAVLWILIYSIILWRFSIIVILIIAIAYFIRILLLEKYQISFKKVDKK